MGISFYTFQTVSYVIDVYRGNIPAEKHFGYYAAFVSFFPQLVAGPIERASNLLPQIKAEKRFDERQASDGVVWLVNGYFRKLVVADLLAPYVDSIYANLHNCNGFALALAVFFFTLQIYCDFSGYSCIAIGSAKLMGIRLMDNFRSPYFAVSIRDFWARWHISLSTWFRDYVYIPLGGNRCSRARQRLNLMITFLVSGLWHGASWTFVVWGGIHGVAQVVENCLSRPLERLRRSRVGRLVLWLAVFAFCNAAWVFFRAERFSDAAYVFTHLFMGVTSPLAYVEDGLSALGIKHVQFLYLCGMVTILALLDWIDLKKGLLPFINSRREWQQWVILALSILFVVIFAQKGVATEFVYFQF